MFGPKHALVASALGRARGEGGVEDDEELALVEGPALELVEGLLGCDGPVFGGHGSYPSKWSRRDSNPQRGVLKAPTRPTGSRDRI